MAYRKAAAYHNNFECVSLVAGIFYSVFSTKQTLSNNHIHVKNGTRRDVARERHFSAEQQHPVELLGVSRGGRVMMPFFIPSLSSCMLFFKVIHLAGT